MAFSTKQVIQSPCSGCSARSPLCHSRCAAYKIYKDKIGEQCKREEPKSSYYLYWRERKQARETCMWKGSKMFRSYYSGKHNDK